MFPDLRALPPPSPRAPGTPAAAGAAGETTGPTGEGWVVQLRGYHYHNKNRGLEGAGYVREKFLKKLDAGKVELPVGKNHALEFVPIKDLGVSYPVLINPSQIVDEPLVDPQAQEEEDDPAQRPRSRTVNVPRFDFVVQFCWQETPPTVRAKKKAERTAAAAAAAPAAEPGPPAATGGAAAPPRL